ncbi:MAG: chromosomal replication initiator protein DnaA [Myxococcota bacterium]
MELAQQSPAGSGAAQLWQGALARLVRRLNPHVYQSWFCTVRPEALDAHELTLAVPSVFHQDWLSNHYLALIEEAVAAEGGARRLRFTIDPSLEPAEHKQPEGAAPARVEVVREPRERIPSRLQDRYTFENYVEGPSNQFAYAACQAVAERPAQNYNPLFIFGGVGLGKTHLLHAIGNRIHARNPGWNVLYVSGEDFTNEVIAGIQHGRMDAFRNRYRTSCDVLLVDDIHFIAGKDRTQEEFFHSFNHLHALGKQMVLTSDRFPHEIEGLEDRLRTRLQWGLIADIQPPELETRVAILRSKAEQQKVSLPDDVAVFLATHIRNNVRELEGSLVRLVAASSLKKRPLDLDLCKQELRDQVLRSARVPTCADILKHVASYYNVNVAELRGSRRQRNITLPRHMAMYLCRKYTQASFPEIGAAFGGKDHTTVMASVRRIEELIRTDADAAMAAEQLSKLVDS